MMSHHTFEPTGFKHPVKPSGEAARTGRTRIDVNTLELRVMTKESFKRRHLVTADPYTGSHRFITFS